MIGILLATVTAVVVEKIPLHIIGIFPSHLAGHHRFYVRESQYSNQGFRVSNSEAPEDRWIDRFSFYAYSTEQAGTSAYYVHKGSNPDRYLVGTSMSPPQGWMAHIVFYAYASVEAAKTAGAKHAFLKPYFCSQDKMPSMADDEKFIVAINNTALQAPWGVKPLTFYAYAPDIVVESLRYMAGHINSEQMLLPGYTMIIEEEYDDCDFNLGRSALLTRVSNDPKKYYGLLGFRCSSSEQLSLLAPMLRLPNIGLSSQAALASYTRSWRLHTNEIDYTRAMFDIITSECQWHRFGVSFAGARYKSHVDDVLQHAVENGVTIGFTFDTTDPANDGKSAWDIAAESNSRVVAVFGPPSDITRLLCEQVKERRSGLVVLSTHNPKDGARFWRDGLDPVEDAACTRARMDEAARTMLFFSDPHLRSENLPLGCISKTSSVYATEWNAHVAANNIEPDGIGANAADSICVFAKLSQDFRKNMRRFTLHDETRNINSASSMCIERGGFLAIIETSIPADLKALIEGGKRLAYLIAAKRVGNFQWKTLDFKTLLIPNALWDPFAGFGKDTHDYVGLHIVQGEVKLKELGDAIGLSGDTTVGYICEYGPMFDMVVRTSEESFSALNERMKLIDFEGLTGRLRFKVGASFSHSARTAVKARQVKMVNGEPTISDVGKYDLVLNAWAWNGGSRITGLEWLQPPQDACQNGRDGFPQCAAGKRPEWFGCTWIACDEAEGMSGAAPDCRCADSWYNKTVGVLTIESWSCVPCTEDVDAYFCPENKAEDEVMEEPTNDTEVIDAALLEITAQEKRVLFVLTVPATVQSVTLNAAFAEAIETAAEDVYGLETRVQVNYITSGNGRRLELRDVNESDTEWILEVPLTYPERRLQNVLHTTVMFKVFVMRRYEAPLAKREENFAEQMKIKLNQVFQGGNSLAGYQVVQVEFPAPAIQTQMNTTNDCPELPVPDNSMKPLEILGLCFIAVAGLVVVGGSGYLIRGHLPGLPSRRSKTYVTHIGPPEHPEKMIAINDTMNSNDDAPGSVNFTQDSPYEDDPFRQDEDAGQTHELSSRELVKDSGKSTPRPID